MNKTINNPVPTVIAQDRVGEFPDGLIVGKPSTLLKKEVNATPVTKHVAFDKNIILNKLSFFVDVIRKFDTIDANGCDNVKKSMDRWIISQMASDIYSSLQLDRFEWEFDAALKSFKKNEQHEKIMLKKKVADAKPQAFFDSEGNVLKGAGVEVDDVREIIEVDVDELSPLGNEFSLVNENGEVGTLKNSSESLLERVHAAMQSKVNEQKKTAQEAAKKVAKKIGKKTKAKSRKPAKV